MTNQDFQQPKSILDMVESTVSFLSVSVFSTFPRIIYLNFYFFLLSLFKCILQFAKPENTGWYPETARGLFTP